MSESAENSLTITSARRSILPAFALGLACILLFVALLSLRPHVPGDASIAGPLDDILLWNSLLPRAAVAVIAGAALGLAGALLQRVLRNPIADASTLGIASGAQLALTLALSFSPVVAGVSRELIAFAGGLLAVIIVLALSWRRGLDPVTVAVSGMIVGLITASLSVTLILARGEYALSINIWGAGALNQQDWSVALSLAPRLFAGILLAWLLTRPLTVLALDDASARSLGVALLWVRLAILVLSVWLSASVTAAVGIIGFLGLAAPATAKICGARTTGQLIMAAPLTGAAILFIGDCLTQILGPGFSDLAPTGAAIALLGGPLLLVLLPRVHGVSTATQNGSAVAKSLRRPATMLCIMAVGVILVLALALTISPTSHGWGVATGPLLFDLLPFRLPRILTAGGAGAMLGAAGFVIQRVTGNPIASPEVIGVSSGGGAGLTLALLLTGMPSGFVMLVSTASGSLLAFLLMMAIAGRSGFSSERLLLAGIAVSAFCMAIVSIMLAQGDMRSYVLLNWMAGSTSGAGSFEAWSSILSLVVLTAPLFFMTRWLTILPLGIGLSQSLGVGIVRPRLILAVFAALMTAVASLLVGPLSLTGLIAPHLARLIGFRTPQHQLLATIMLGAGILVCADWLARIVIYPYQVPVGLFAALIGGPYLLWLLGGKETVA